MNMFVFYCVLFIFEYLNCLIMCDVFQDMFGKELNGIVFYVEVLMNIIEEMCKILLWKIFVKDGFIKKFQSCKSKFFDKYKYKYRYYYKNKYSSRYRRVCDVDDG